MQEIDLYLSGEQILRSLKKGYALVIWEIDDELCDEIVTLPAWGPVQFDNCLLYFTPQDYEYFDNDNEVIQYLKDYCYRIEDYNIKMLYWGDNAL